jgi:hypothetical protein
MGARSVAVLTIGIALACGSDAVGPNGEPLYHLSRVDGTGLPAALPGPGGSTLLSGQILLSGKPLSLVPDNPRCSADTTAQVTLVLRRSTGPDPDTLRIRGTYTVLADSVWLCWDLTFAGVIFGEGWPNEPGRLRARRLFAGSPDVQLEFTR